MTAHQHDGLATDRTSRSSDSLAMFLPALAVIIVVTAVTIEVSEPFINRSIARKITRPDVIANLLLYLPLGAALAGRRLWFAALVAAGASGIAESIQLFYPDRFPSPVDIVTNTLGAILGVVAARLILRYTKVNLSAITLGVVTGILALVSLSALVLAVSDPHRPSGFSNWDPSFRVAVGDELSGDRPWHGEIHGLAILKDPLDAAAIKTLASDGPGSLVTREDAVMLMRGPLNESNSLWGQPLLDEAATHTLYKELVAQNTLTILVWFRGKGTQIGDGRIVTFSKDPFARNFTVGHYQGTIFFRLRTPRTGPNGMDPQVVTPSLPYGGRAVFAAATFDGRVSRLYIDGRLLARLNLAAYEWRIPFLADSGLPATAALAGMFLAVTVLSVGGRRARDRKWILGPAAGLAAAGLLVLIGATAAVPAFTLWVPIFACAGGLIIATSVTRTT